MRKIIWHLPRIKKAFLVFFLLLSFLSLGGLFWNFYQDNTVGFPAEGGTFREAAVAVVDQNFVINPLLVTGNQKATSVEADISRLVFAGLMKFDNPTGEIVDHLADHTLSTDKKTYTFMLKEGLTWHDGAPITIADVIFTYQTLLQDPEFPNRFLREAFKEVLVEQIDEKSVAFTIPKPYKFFLTNFTIGLLPQHLLGDFPPNQMHLAEFNQDPIGAGAYRFAGIDYREESPMVTVSLEAFPEYISGKAKISLIDFELFPNNELLMRNISGLDALHPKLQSQYDFLKDNEDFKLLDFTIPQYVAVFLNMDSPKLSGDEKRKTRLALQLATDKEEILESVPGKRIDTPLLETDITEWLFEHDTEKAAGGLKDSGWFLPGTEPDKTEENEEQTEVETEEEEVAETEVPAGQNKYVYHPSKQVDFSTSTKSDFILGTFPTGTTAVRVNGYGLRLFNPSRGRFSYKIDYNIGTLKAGKNTYKIEFFQSRKKLGEEEITIHLDEAAEASVVATPDEDTETTDDTQPETVVAETETAPEITEVVLSDIPEHIRRNQDGEPLTLRLVTISSPSFYPETAEILKQQWEKVGIHTTLEILDQKEFLEKAILKKDYELLLYGQNLGYNPDAFPFWHFSQAEEGSNLSKYKSFEAGILLTEVRQSHEEELRTQKLIELREIIKKDVPAVFLFSPTYTMPVSGKVKNIHTEHIALLPDRFSNIEELYVREARMFHPEKNWFDFFPWFFSAVKDMFS